MKLMHSGEGHLLRVSAVTHDLHRYNDGSDHIKRDFTDATFVGLFVAILALYAMMFVVLYCLSRHAPVFVSDSAAASAIGKAILSLP